MRVLYITYNGLMEPISQSQVIPYLRELSLRYGIKFIILSFERHEHLKDIKGFRKVEENIKKWGINWFHLRYHKRMRAFATGLDLLNGFGMAVYLILKKDIHIIHARSYVPALISLFAGKVLKKRYIFDMRGLMADEYVDGGILKKINPLYHVIKLFEKILLIHASYVIVLTHKIKQIMEQKNFLKNKRNFFITAIPCCADCDRFKPSTAGSQELKGRTGALNKRILIYIGSVGTWYLLPEMIDFFKTYKKRIQNAFLILLTQWPQDGVRNLLQKKGLEQENYYLGSASPEEVPAYINLAEAGLFFCKNCYSKYASSPTKIGEYLACGIPVIANTGIGDVDEIVRSHNIGVIIDELNEKGYERGMDTFFKLLEEEQSLNVRCRHVAEGKLSLEYGVETYLNIYRHFSKV